MKLILSRVPLSMALFLLTSLGLQTGCVSLSKPYVAKQAYAIEVDVPTEPVGMFPDQMLRVRQIRVATPYDDTSMMRRHSDGTYHRDFYNVYVAPPGALLTGQTTRYLRASGPYPIVTDSGSLVMPDLVLEGRVTRLLADDSQPQGPHAVIEAHFFLIDESTEAATVVMQESYTARIALSDNSPATLAKALSQAWAEVLGSLADDLSQKASKQSLTNP